MAKAKTDKTPVKKSPKRPSKDAKVFNEPRDGNDADQSSDAWPLEADRLAQSNPLLECLALVAGHYGRRTSIASLIAGLPIQTKNLISPSLFIRAAERVDLNAKLVDKTFSGIEATQNFPCVLMLAENQSCILWAISGNESIIQHPETPDEKVTVYTHKLQELYTGQAFYIRPVARVDDRAGPAGIDTGRDWFWGVFKKHKVIYGEVLLSAVMINLFGLVSSLFVMTVYDRVVPNNAIETLWTLTAGVVVVYIFDFITKNLRAAFLDWAGRKADVEISASLFEQILGMTMTSRPASAGVLASKMREFETIRDFFTSASLIALIDLPFVFVYIGFIALVAGPLAFVPLAGIPFIIGLGLYLQKPLNKVVSESLHENALKNALLFETFTGLETIKVQAAESYTQRSWEEISDKASETAFKTKRITTLAQNWTTFVQQLVSVFVVVFGVFLIQAGELSMGGMIAAVILSGRAMIPLAQVSGLMTRLSQTMQSLQHLDEMMRAAVERPKNKHFISKVDFKGKIDFQNIVFHYPEQTMPALQDVSFTIKPGERIGVIGAVGSGKTTLERLILNLYEPDSGSVQIDGTDVRQIEPGDLRRNVGAVQQSPQIFYGSVRQNITMGHETASDRAVMRAAEMSGVMEFLAETSAGLDTFVGERGESLSGGQRQAIAIARALLYDPPILIMDEPTASMDPASESRLRKRLEVLCADKTTIIITHKGSMLPLVDKIILMDKGRIVAFGPRDDIIKKLQARQYGTTAENTSV